MVILKKAFKSVFFDKLRSIMCLNKFSICQEIVFSRKMEELAQKNNLVPPEQCAVPSRERRKGTTLKTLDTAMHRTMHNLHTIRCMLSEILQLCILCTSSTGHEGLWYTIHSSSTDAKLFTNHDLLAPDSLQCSQ